MTHLQIEDIYQVQDLITLCVGLCKLENEILKEAKNTEKSHF